METIDLELKQYLPQILEQAKNGIMVSNPNLPHNPVIYVNNTTCELFEYSKEDFLGKNCNFLQRDDKDQPGLKAISKALKKQSPQTVTVRNYTKSGKLIYNQFTISPIFDENKKLKYFLGIQRDVTNETLLKQYNRQLQDEQLENAQYNAIGKLSAGISHEINTPLTIIGGHIDMLELSISSLDEKISTEINEELDGIKNNLKRIKNITESMREIADIKTFQIDTINLFRPIVGALRLTHYKAKHICKIKLQKKFFDLDLQRDSYKFFIEGDFRKIQQVFMILIDNALDQLEHNNKKIEENLISIDLIEKDHYTQVIFKDNGGGIDASIMENIFKPFNSNKKHKGLGIGICIVKKIVDEHQFHITIENDQSGVVVKITVPRD